MCSASGMPGTPGHKMVRVIPSHLLQVFLLSTLPCDRFGVRTVLAAPDAGSTIQFSIYLAIEDPDDESTVAPTAETR